MSTDSVWGGGGVVRISASSLHPFNADVKLRTPNLNMHLNLIYLLGVRCIVMETGVWLWYGGIVILGLGRVSLSESAVY